MARKKEHADTDGAHDLEGRYANYFMVGYNAFEFVLDFGQYYAEDERVQLHTRIVTGPGYAKELQQFLQECLDKYELDFGDIADSGADGDQRPE